MGAFSRPLSTIGSQPWTRFAAQQEASVLKPEIVFGKPTPLAAATPAPHVAAFGSSVEDEGSQVVQAGLAQVAADEGLLATLSVNLHLLRPRPFPGSASSSDSLRVWADYQGGFLCGWGANLVLILFHLDVRGRLRTCAVCDFIHLHLLFLWHSIVCSHSPYTRTRHATREREVGASSTRYRSLLMKRA